jgi:hypothetical protein
MPEACTAVGGNGAIRSLYRLRKEIGAEGLMHNEMKAGSGYLMHSGYRVQADGDPRL